MLFVFEVVCAMADPQHKMNKAMLYLDNFFMKFTLELNIISCALGYSFLVWISMSKKGIRVTYLRQQQDRVLGR